MRPWTLSCLLVLLAAAGCDPAEPAGQQEAPQSAAGKADGADATNPRPPRVTLVDNSMAAGGFAGPARAQPQLRSVTSAQLGTALGALSTDIEFADYPFSGCHDRAHVTYLHLAGSLGSDAVAKVWLFGPALMTVALDGGLTAPIDAGRWGAETTLWDYHVAAIVLEGGQLRVVDPVLADVQEPPTLEQWLDAIESPPGSVYTLLDGDLYSFNTAGPSSFSGGRMPLNGGMFEYVGFARTERWLESNLARDAVADALAEDPFSCQSLSSGLDDPQFLVDSLLWMSTQTGNSPGCQPLVDLFVDERDAWTVRLDQL
jgi:hypothetical protein